MLTLARFSLGRVVLHLIAMLRDGAFGFHGAGILREFAGRRGFCSRPRRLSHSPAAAASALPTAAPTGTTLAV
jgi:hypothetical protein